MHILTGDLLANIFGVDQRKSLLSLVTMVIKKATAKITNGNIGGNSGKKCPNCGKMSKVIIIDIYKRQVDQKFAERIDKIDGRQARGRLNERINKQRKKDLEKDLSKLRERVIKGLPLNAK